MSNAATASATVRARWVSLVGGLVALACGAQANGPTTVPQAPPAPLEPAITGHFVDEEAVSAGAPADAGVDAAPAPTDAAPASPSVVPAAPDASGH
jgi:hypothetical protein